MNPFEAHGIDHLSPSSCALFAAEPALWVVEKLLKRRVPVGTAAHRGSAAEHGVALALNGTPVEEAQHEAMLKFATLSALSGDPRRDKHAQSIPGMVEQGALALAALGPPESAQGKVIRKVEGLHVPILGYYDFAWPGHVVDLKTSDTVPSAVRASHARQVAFYAACIGGDNCMASVCYASGKKFALAKIEGCAQHLAVLERIARTIQRFVAVSRDPHELAGLLVPDVESFYYSDPMARRAAFEVFGV